MLKNYENLTLDGVILTKPEKEKMIFELEIRIIELEADKEKLKLKCVGLTDNRYCTNCNIMCNNKNKEG